jgi:uncharacterized membrane protein
MKKAPFVQFGFLEIQVFLACTVILYFALVHLNNRGVPTRGENAVGAVERRTSGAAPIFLVLALVISAGGAWLASRLATQHGIESLARRAALQLLCTLGLVPPLLCVAIVLLPLVAYSLAIRWSAAPPAEPPAYVKLIGDLLTGTPWSAAPPAEPPA